METSAFIYALMQQLENDEYVDDESFKKLDLELRQNTAFCFAVYLQTTGKSKEEEIFEKFRQSYEKVMNTKISKNYLFFYFLKWLKQYSIFR
jgi:SUMO ligase MMS21 Smc5/6 complex component